MTRTYRVTRRTVLFQTFTVNAESRHEAIAAVRELPTERDTEEWDDPRVVSASQTKVPAWPTFSAIRVDADVLQEAASA